MHGVRDLAGRIAGRSWDGGPEHGVKWLKRLEDGAERER
jgi:hypothetical protein